MKNLFKYLSVAALVGSIGFSTMGVNAATNLTSIGNKITCDSNETLKRDYLLFLDSNGAGTFNGIEAGKVRAYKTSGKKYNQVSSKTSLSKTTYGEIDVVSDNGNKTTATTEGTSIKTWKASEYWTNYALAVNKRIDSTLTFTDGDESYVLHSGWRVYNDSTGEEIGDYAENVDQNNKLNAYLQNTSNIEKIASNGTLYPPTELKRPEQGAPGNGNTAQNIDWVVRREYKSTIIDGVDGVSIEGVSGKRYYSPFVVYVEYCVDNGSGEKDPVANKELKYVKNIDAEVTDMPTDETFEDKTKVSTSAPKATGYRFLGWSTDAKATTADEKYKAGSEITETTTLYAIWQKSDGTFTVTYDANGGKNAPAKQTEKDGACLKISNQKPTQTGFNFLGWSTKKDAQEPDKKYAAGADYCGDAGNVTLYAVWQTRTGVSAHLIAFGTVALAAVGALVVAKKKNLFRQI